MIPRGGKKGAGGARNPPPMERRSLFERDGPRRYDCLFARRPGAVAKRRRTGSRAPPDRRFALPQPAPVSSLAARRQAEQGASAGLGAEPLLLPEHDTPQRRRGDLAVPRSRDSEGMAAPNRRP